MGAIKFSYPRFTMVTLGGCWIWGISWSAKKVMLTQDASRFRIEYAILALSHFYNSWKFPIQMRSGQDLCWLIVIKAYNPGLLGVINWPIATSIKDRRFTIPFKRRKSPFLPVTVNPTFCRWIPHFPCWIPHFPSWIWKVPSWIPRPDGLYQPAVNSEHLRAPGLRTFGLSTPSHNRQFPLLGRVVERNGRCRG